MQKVKHLRLRLMAQRMIDSGAAAHAVPVNHVYPADQYLEKVEAHLRSERLALTDAAFRSKYSDILVYAAT